MSYKLSPVPHANLWHDGTQTYTGTTDGQNVFINNIDDFSGGIYITDGYKINFTNPGQYEMIYSIIVSQSSGTNIDYEIWFQDSGVDVPNSNTGVLVGSSNVKTLVTVSIISTATGSNYASLRWYCSSANGSLLATAAGTSPTRPAVPSVLITIKKVSN